jgi:SNF family Na+-dependent transporter
MFTATVPYLIIVLMFIRGVTLPGAQLGLDYYIFKPNMAAIYDANTWRKGIFR